VAPKRKYIFPSYYVSTDQAPRSRAKGMAPAESHEDTWRRSSILSLGPDESLTPLLEVQWRDMPPYVSAIFEPGTPEDHSDRALICRDSINGYWYRFLYPVHGLANIWKREGNASLWLTAIWRELPELTSTEVVGQRKATPGRVVGQCRARRE
jgi:hypothetical protein